MRKERKKKFRRRAGIRAEKTRPGWRSYTQRYNIYRERAESAYNIRIPSVSTVVDSRSAALPRRSIPYPQKLYGERTKREIETKPP